MENLSGMESVYIDEYYTMRACFEDFERIDA